MAVNPIYHVAAPGWFPCTTNADLGTFADVCTSLTAFPLLCHSAVDVPMLQ